MTSPSDAISALLEMARGTRPQSMSCGDAEDVLNVAFALLVELAVANDRIDRLERLVAELRGENVAVLRAICYEGEITEQRQEAIDALFARSLRIFADPRTAPVSAAAARAMHRRSRQRSQTKHWAPL